MLISQGLTEKKLADYLRSGKADQRFLNILAMILDPPPNKKPLYRLHLQKARAHRPKGATYDEAALVSDLRELEQSQLNRGEKKAARIDVLARYGVSDRTARLAMQEANNQDQIWEWMQSREAQGMM